MNRIVAYIVVAIVLLQTAYTEADDDANGNPKLNTGFQVDNANGSPELKSFFNPSVDNGLVHNENGFANSSVDSKKVEVNTTGLWYSPALGNTGVGRTANATIDYSDPSKPKANFSALPAIFAFNNAIDSEGKVYGTIDPENGINFNIQNSNIVPGSGTDGSIGNSVNSVSEN